MTVSPETRKRQSDAKRTLEYKLRHRASVNRRNGRPEGWAGEALDAYLGGMSLTEIAQVFDVTQQSVSTAIAKEALFRLMAQHAAERLEEMGLGTAEARK